MGDAFPEPEKRKGRLCGGLLEQHDDDGGNGEDNPRGAHHQAEKAIVIHLRPHCSSAKCITPQQRGLSRLTF